MAKNEKAKQVPVKKVRSEKEVAVAPSPLFSPLRAWEREVERMFEEFPFHWPRLRALEPFRFSRGLRLRVPALDLYVLAALAIAHRRRAGEGAAIVRRIAAASLFQVA